MKHCEIKNKNNKETKSLYKYHWVCWPSIAGPGACPKVWLVYPVRLFWKELSFQLEAVISCRRLWVRNGGSSPFPLSELRFICADPVHAASLCKFICISVLLCLDGLVSLVSLIPTSSWNLSASCSFLNHKGRDLVETYHSRLNV